jgi:hypothetical protein
MNFFDRIDRILSTAKNTSGSHLKYFAFDHENIIEEQVQGSGAG